MCLWETGWEVLELIHLTQDRGKWCTPVNTVTKLWIPIKGEEFLD
jgi:hypothetical protein